MPSLVRIFLIFFSIVLVLFLLLASIPIRIAPPDWDFPQDSSTDAKKVGTFIKAVQLNPSEALANTKRGRFLEAWIETKRKTYNSLLYHSNQRVPGYFLCIAYEESGEEEDFPFFVRDSKGEIVGWSGRPASKILLLEVQLTEIEFERKYAEFTVVPDYNVLQGEKVRVDW